MTAKLLLILNPRAGILNGKDNLFKICNTFCAADYDVSIRITQAPEHATEIVKIEGALYDKIVCCGGDGTLHEVVCGIQQLPTEKRPLLGYIPAGTTNDFAQNFGISTDPIKAAERIVNPEIVDIDIGKFGESELHNNYFTYIASTGAFSDTSYRTPQKAKNTLGYMAYVLDGLAHLSDIKPFHMKVTTSDQIFEDNYIFAAVSNSTTVGKMIKIDKIGVDMTDGLFELILIKNPQNIKDSNAIAMSLLAPNDPKLGLVRAQASEIRFELENDSVWTLDGEMAKAPRDFTVTNMPRAIRFMK